MPALRAVSPLSAAIILFSIAAAGGLFFYGFLSGWMGALTSRVEVQTVSVDLIKAGDKVLFTVSVKNTGSKPVIGIVVSGVDDNGRRFSLALPPADPGETVSSSIILSTAASNYGALYGIGECGVVTVGSTPVTVSFSKEYGDPVVVAVPRLPAGTYRSGGSAAQHHIITEVTGAGFTIAQMESPAGDGVVDETEVAWLALEKGVHRIGGLLVEAGEVEVGGGYQAVSFTAQFSSSPSVAAAAQTNRNNLQVRTRIRSVTSTGFQVQLEAGDTSTPSLTYTETVGYIAIEDGVDESAGLEAHLTPREVSHNFRTYSFTLTYGEPPVVIAHLDSEYGGDPAYAVTRDVTASDFEVAVEETAGVDGPHTTEIIGWISVSTDPYSFTAGNSYSVTVTAYTSDGDTFFKGLTVKCSM